MSPLQGGVDSDSDDYDLSDIEDLGELSSPEKLPLREDGVGATQSSSAFGDVPEATEDCGTDEEGPFFTEVSPPAMSAAIVRQRGVVSPGIVDSAASPGSPRRVPDETPIRSVMPRIDETRDFRLRVEVDPSVHVVVVTFTILLSQRIDIKALAGACPQAFLPGKKASDMANAFSFHLLRDDMLPIHCAAYTNGKIKVSSLKDANRAVHLDIGTCLCAHLKSCPGAVEEPLQLHVRDAEACVVKLGARLSFLLSPTRVLGVLRSDATMLRDAIVKPPTSLSGITVKVSGVTVVIHASGSLQATGGTGCSYDTTSGVLCRVHAFLEERYEDVRCTCAADTGMSRRSFAEARKRLWKRV